MKNPHEDNQDQLIEGYIKGEAREFFIITGWIEKVVNNYNLGIAGLQRGYHPEFI